MSYRGYSILEILIAITILVSAVIPIIYTYQYSSVSNYKSIKSLQAANLAIEKMEEFKYSGRTPLYFGIEGNDLFRDINEYSRLKALLDYERNKNKSKSYIPYKRVEEYGEIKGLPDFKREIKIAFFPIENFEPENFISPFEKGNTSIANPMGPDTSARLAKRICIYVTITYKDKTKKNKKDIERKFTSFTIVTNKE